MFNMGYLLDYSKIFDGEPSDFTSYLDGIGTDTIVKFCSHFLSIDMNMPENKDINSFLNNWFSSANEELRNNILKKIDALSPYLKRNIVVINNYNILTLFEYSFNNLPHTTTLEEAQLEKNLFKCILTLNEDFNKRDERISNTTDHLDNSENHPAKILVTSIIYYDLIFYNLKEKIITQFIKSILLFKFLENHNDATKNLLSELINSFDANSWEDFLKKYLPIVHGLLNPNRNGSLEINVEQNESANENIRFLDKISINNEISIEELDFIGLRSKPFYKNGEYKYQIISPLFTCEKIYEGLYFLLNKINNELREKNELHVEDNFRGFYCSKFSEEYLLYEIIDRSFPKKDIRYSGKNLRARGISGEPDYYVRNKNKLFLFESKDVLINAENKQSNDFNVIKSSLQEKFYYYTRNGTTYYIGINQIVNNIRKILTDQYTFDKVKKDTIRIYPILITHHSIYNSPGLNFFINKWFSNELESLRKENINIDKVKPLIIIDIDFFILYHEVIKNRTVILEHLLDDYIQRTRFKPPNILSATANEALTESVESFSSYIDQHIPVKNKMKTPALFKNLGLELF